MLKKQPEWIYDISEFLRSNNVYRPMGEYMEKNPEADDEAVATALEKLMGIKKAPIGIIALSDELDIETVAEIFVRINSKGVALSSADFVMSKISSYGDQGRNLRKLIDYFAHLAVSPHDYGELRNDEEFVQTKYWKEIEWLKDDTQRISTIRRT